jgi:Ca-activated chloride channel homolog
MRPKISSKSLALRFTLLVVLVLLGSIGSSLLSQSPPTVLIETQPTVPAAMHDPTRRGTQPGLDVDRDPVPSPDPESNPPVGTKMPSADRPGEVQKRQDGMYAMHTDVDEVLLNCAVVDEKGRSVTDLGQSDFRIWEDGTLQTTKSFLHQDLPVSLGILIDNSGSMLDKRAAVNSAALNLLRASNPQDATFIVNFSDRAILDQGFTTNLDALNRGLSHFDSKGTTALYDAVAASAGELSNNGKHPKQVLLVITDGADNASRLSLEQAIRRVQGLGGPVVYSIGLLFETEKEESQRARQALETLSQETGGIAYFPRSLQDVDSIAAEVARDIRNQYTIGYHSSKQASIEGYRVVHVETKAANHGKMIVRTRRGYFAKERSPQHGNAVQEAMQ